MNQGDDSFGGVVQSFDILLPNHCLCSACGEGRTSLRDAGAWKATAGMSNWTQTGKSRCNFEVKKTKVNLRL